MNFFINTFILIGNGGTGKSHLINVLSKWIEKILSGAGEIKPKVLLLAFSGAAACLIGNMEIFRLLSSI